MRKKDRVLQKYWILQRENKARSLYGHAVRNYRTPQTSLFEDYRREGKYFKIGILYWKVRTTLDHGKRKLSGLAFFLDEEGRLVCSSLICFSFLKELEKKNIIITSHDSMCVCVWRYQDFAKHLTLRTIQLF